MGISTTSDSKLLTEWVTHRREAAFHAIVSRYASLVHMAARRTCGDHTLAADASQLVFILLAQKAKSLTNHPSLAGWLHITAVKKTHDLMDKARRESRKRQQFKVEMDTKTSPQIIDTSWRELQPVLDSAIAALSSKDREALLLRFYRSLTVREIATTLGIETHAAQKRIDRATERLRSKLIKRGYRTTGGLAGVMLSGFAADAQAALPEISILSSKAIAASSASPGVFSTITTSFATMKTTSAALPLVSAIAAGFWVALQWQSIAELESGNASLRQRLYDSSQRTPLARKTDSVKTAMDHKPIDWEEVARQLGDGWTTGYLNPNLRIHEVFRSMNREELINSLDEILAAELSEKSRSVLLSRVMSLLIEIDPEYLTKRFFAQSSSATTSQIPDPTQTISLQAFSKWAYSEPENATIWLDDQIMEGNIMDKYPYEPAVISSLLISNEAAAIARLIAIPEAKRRDILSAYAFGGQWNDDDWKDRDIVAEYGKLARLLPEEDKQAFIITIVTELGEVDRNQLIKQVQFGKYGLKGIDNAEAITPPSAMEEYFQRIDATDSERIACIDAVARSLRFPTASRGKIEPSDFESYRQWVNKQTPNVRDKVTISAVQRMKYKSDIDFGEWTESVLRWHQEGGGDDLLIAWLQHPNASNRKDLARALAAKIFNMEMREKYLNMFKP